MVQICHLDTGWYDGDPGMTSDLWKLRAWLTLKEAADYLSSKTGLDVDESNILRLALDGKLQLSLNFLKPIEAIQYREGAELEEHRTQIEGIWDLLVQGPVRLELENRYRATCGLPHVELDPREKPFGTEGAFVTGEEGVVYQLLPFLNLLSGSSRNPSVLPVGSLLGVRPHALDAVVASLASPSLGPEEQQPSKPDDATDPLDKPLMTRERATLLTIIAALARAADIDILKASKAGDTIEALTVELRARVSARAIEDHLKRIPDALERRGNVPVQLEDDSPEDKIHT